MNYSVEAKGISFVSLFGEKLIPFEEIVEIKKVKIWEAMIKGCNPLRPPMMAFSAGLNVVLIELKSRRLIGFSPRDLDKFLKVSVS